MVLLVTGLAFSQYRTSYTGSFLDSAAVTDSFRVPAGTYPITLTLGDYGPKITEFEFDIKDWATNTWYTIFTADSNFAVKVSDNVSIPLPDWFKKYKGSPWTYEPLYMRLDPNDSDTITRSFKIEFEGE